MSGCPFALREFEVIKDVYPTLASTGCTRDFCQAGRIIHTDEPRVGENRDINIVEREAEDFLRELHRENFFADEEAFQLRLQDVLNQIRSTAAEGVIRETKEQGVVGGHWIQTPRELEFGLRRSWRNSRKCVMRSHCEELRLCDLRSVKTSAKMAVELAKALSEAFNDGNILPTVFVFPPRTANNRGPMIWNDQLLTFAGYEQEDGSILGDPKNIQLTKDIVELGWEPPQPKTRWDILPLVTMAEGDIPVMFEFPPHLTKLVELRHPKYGAAFEQLDLKWAPFPALSRLGFDIGGVQYTATPFIGWFMDAEIGVRNLADSFRYNVLPDVVKALGLDDGALQTVDSFEDLPEFERLAMLSRAQAELNYAAQYSFIQEKITMSDSLTASQKWIKYDEEFLKKNGYRLPSDPYWLMPPEGSIVPLWHRGGAPNYQPKPMICRHVQDPAKVWKRERSSWPVMAPRMLGAATMFTDSATPSIRAKSSISSPKQQVTNETLNRSTRTPSESTLNSLTNKNILEASIQKKLEYQRTPSLSEVSFHEPTESPTPNSEDLIVEVPARYQRYAQELSAEYKDATLVTTTPGVYDVFQGSLRVIMDIGSVKYDALGCIQVLPCNSRAKVDRVLQTLGVKTSDFVKLDAENTRNPTYRTFLQEYADLELPFLELKWLKTIETAMGISISKEKLGRLSTLDALEYLRLEGVFSRPCPGVNLPYQLCLDMPLLLARTYSVASSLRFLTDHKSPKKGGGNEVEIIVKVHEHGRFSDVCLKDLYSSQGRAALKFRFIESIAANRLRQEPEDVVPIVAITTGAGFGPVRSLLQERIAMAKDAVAAGKPLPPRKKGISLFLGLQPGDVALVTDVLVEASSFNLIDMFFMVPSNDDKIRVYDKMKIEGVSEQLRGKLMDQSGMVFVCTGPKAAKETAGALETVIGSRVKKTLGVRYVEEVY